MDTSKSEGFSTEGGPIIEEQVRMDEAIRHIHNQAIIGRWGDKERKIWNREAWDNFMTRIIEDLGKKKVSPEGVEQVRKEIQKVTDEKVQRNEFEVG